MIEGGHRGQVKAYTRYRRLGEDASRAASSYRDVLAAPDDQIVWEMEVGHAHGAVACHLDDFVNVGGYDPAFVGWGYEDLAFDLAFESIVGPTARVPGDLIHIWHQPHETAAEDDPYHLQNMARYYDRYVPAAGDPDALRALRFEGQQGWPL